MPSAGILKSVQERVGRPVRIEDDAEYVQLIETRFPMGGSKIDWTAVGGCIVSGAPPREFVAAGRLFWDRVVKDAVLRAEREVVVAGDSAMAFAVHLRVREVAVCIDLFLSLPQHTYVLERGGAWCADFTLEGDFGFGRAPACF